MSLREVTLEGIVHLSRTESLNRETSKSSELGKRAKSLNFTLSMEKTNPMHLEERVTKVAMNPSQNQWIMEN